MTSLERTLKIIQKQETVVIPASVVAVVTLAGIPLLLWFFFRYSLWNIALLLLAWGILIPLFMTGMARIFIIEEQGYIARVRDLFYFKKLWWEFLLQSLLAYVCIALGLVLIIPGIVFAMMWAQAPYHMAFAKKGIIAAMKQSVEDFFKTGYLNNIKKYMLLTGLNLLGIIFFIVGEFYAFAVMCGFLAFDAKINPKL